MLTNSDKMFVIQIIRLIIYFDLGIMRLNKFLKHLYIWKKLQDYRFYKSSHGFNPLFFQIVN